MNSDSLLTIASSFEVSPPAIIFVSVILTIILTYAATVKKHGVMTPDLVFKLVALYATTFTFFSFLYGLLTNAAGIYDIPAIWGCLVVGFVADLYLLHQVYLKVFPTVQTHGNP